MKRELAFYGDDFTGSTDVLESLSLRGKKAVLWMSIPDAEKLSQFAEYDCMGVAGISRSKSPEWMTKELPAIYQFLKSLDAKFIHYKVCSTFDSSKNKGNIATAIKVGIEEIQPSWTSVVVGTPKIKRFVCFGELFADFDGTTYRIDRHPVMGSHPATPMTEANLVTHLNNLGLMPAKSITLYDYQTGLDKQKLSHGIDHKDVVVFDSFDVASQQHVGQLIRSHSSSGVHFTASSSGFEDALYSETELVRYPAITGQPRILALSGSCSATTSTQIEHALENGFYPIALDLNKVCSLAEREDYLETVIHTCMSCLSKGQSPLVYSALKSSKFPANPAFIRENNVELDHLLGLFLGAIAQHIATQKVVTRVAVAGGDTSGYCIQSLQLDAMTFISPFCPGVPLCRAHSSNPDIDGLEIALKGGQMGNKDFFVRLLNGDL